jgi:hypothetical protein
MKTALRIAMVGAVLGLVQGVYADSFGSGDYQFEISFVEVGNAGNAADTTGYGGVASTFAIGQFEVSRDMITKANAEGGLAISLLDMSSYGGNVGTHPATGVSWNEAARFVNWLNVSTGHDAAYKFALQPGDSGYSANVDILLWETGDAGYDPSNPYRNANAHYFLPSENEWYKAAYHQNDGVTANYWDYPTGSDTAPTAVSGGTTTGTAVYDQDYYAGPADITNAGGLSAYGTMGQGGNVWEWMESAWDGVNNSSSEFRGLRSGGWLNTEFDLRSSVGDGGPPALEGLSVGFRVASVPEPSSVLLLLLCVGAWLMLRARLNKRTRRVASSD